MNTERFRRRLEEERETLQQILQHGHEELDPDGGGGFDELSTLDQHPADLGTETFEREKSQSIVESAEARLQDIEDAFRRLEAGTYGACEICDLPIGADRLEAVPAARFCIEHQRQMERRGAPRGEPREMTPPP